MSSMAIDGLVSGLDTTSLVNSLMQLEAAPQTQLKAKSSDAANLVSALQGLNTKVASLATSAEKAAAATSWARYTASSSSSAVTATTTSDAAPATLQLRVDQVSAAQVSMVDLSVADLGDPPTITVVRNGTYTQIDASGDLTEIAARINATPAAGLGAVAVRVTDGASPQYRLQLTGDSGAANAFEVYVGDAATVQGYVEQGPPPPGSHLVNSANALISARNARITLWPTGTGTPMTLTSATNSFEGVVSGVTLTVNAPTTGDASPVVLTVAEDRAAMRTLMSDLTGSLKVVLSEVASRTARTTTTSADGRTVVKGGLFSGDSSIRFMVDRLRGATTDAVDGISPSTIGVSISRAGEVTFDEARFNAAMAADPVGTREAAMALAERVSTVAKDTSNSTDGSLTLKITSQQSVVKDLSRDIEAWDRRLELRRESLLKTYSALEVTLSQLQSQSNWLAGQLAGLPSSTSEA
jgi:flagellar hook-associated protein 2